MKLMPIVLTEIQHAETQQIAKSLINKYRIEKIICFASLNSTSRECTIFAEPQQNLKCSYYFLVLTSDNTRIEHGMQDYISKLFPGTFVLAHGLETVTNLVYQCDTFFTNVCIFGALIYTSDGFTIIPEIQESRLQKSYLKDKEAYDRIYNLAAGFLESAFICLENDFDNNVIFLLHQAVEQGCRALIRLFTGYRSDIHNLNRLLEFCCSFSHEPSQLFRRHFSNEKHLFSVLSSSYSDARYKDNYQVNDQEADLLCTQVKAFLDLVAELAKKETAKGPVEVSAEVVDYFTALPASL